MRQCLRCGVETAEDSVFCSDCLSLMESQPVKPGTAVQLPQRPAREKKVPLSPKEPASAVQLRRLRGMVRWLTAIIVILSLVLCLTAGMLIHLLDKGRVFDAIGKNYTTTTGAQP